MKKLLLLVLSVLPWANAQISTSVGQEALFDADRPQPVEQATLGVVGTPGRTVYHYWVVAVYPIGKSYPKEPITIFNAPNTLSMANYVQVSWVGVQRATSYDVLRTNTATLTSGNIAVATGITTTTLADQGGALAPYTVRAASYATGYIRLNNRDFSVPQFEIFPQMNVSNILGAASGDISGTWPNLTVTGVQGIEYPAAGAADGLIRKYRVATGRMEWEPDQTGAAGGGITTLNGLIADPQTFAFDATGLAPGVTSGGAVHTFHLPLASGAGVTSGTISKTNYDNFTTAYILANAATNLDTPSTIVRRDAGGNFAANAVTAALIGNALSATALALDPPPCAANQFANDIAANGTLACAQVAYGQVSGTPASLPPSGAAGGDLAGSTYPNPTVATVGGLGAASVAAGATLANNATNLNTFGAIVKRDGSGAFVASSITSNLVGTVTGNASTATALVANPIDCVAPNYARTIDANGNLGCAQVNYSELGGVPVGGPPSGPASGDLGGFYPGPTINTVTVPKGGTGLTSVTAYMPLIGGTTGTGALQSVAPGTVGHSLQYLGTSTAPAFYSTGTYNCKTFGAIGDDSTDDTTALQACLDAARTANGTALLPKGTYKITSTLNWCNGTGVAPNHCTGNVRIIGEMSDNLSATGSVIKWYGALNGTLIRFNGYGKGELGWITLHGNSLAGKHLLIKGMEYGWIHDVSLIYGATNSIALDTESITGFGGMNQSVLERIGIVQTASGSSGIRLGYPGSTAQGNSQNVFIKVGGSFAGDTALSGADPTSYGLWIEGADNNSFIQTSFDPGVCTINTVANAGGLIQITYSGCLDIQTGAYIRTDAWTGAGFYGLGRLKDWIVTRTGVNTLTLNGSTFGAACAANCGLMSPGYSAYLKRSATESFLPGENVFQNCFFRTGLKGTTGSTGNWFTYVNTGDGSPVPTVSATYPLAGFANIDLYHDDGFSPDKYMRMFGAIKAVAEDGREGYFHLDPANKNVRIGENAVAAREEACSSVYKLCAVERSGNSRAMLETITSGDAILELLNTGNQAYYLQANRASNQLELKSASHNYLVGANATGTLTLANSATLTQAGHHLATGYSTSSVINCKSYGAVGNGVTDDTTAIQNCINALPTTGGTAYLPNGNYKVTSTLTVGNASVGGAPSTRNNITVLGDGVVNYAAFPATGSTRIWWDGATTGPVFQASGEMNGAYFRNLAVDCYNSTHTIAETAFMLYSVTGFEVKNSTISQCAGYAIQLRVRDSTDLIYPAQGTIDSVNIWTSQPFGSGIRIGEASYPNPDPLRYRVSNVFFEELGSQGVAIELGFTDSAWFDGIYGAWGAVGLWINQPTGTYSYPGGITFRDLYLGTDPGLPSFQITGATNASPIEVTTSVAHSFVNNDRVPIHGVKGNLAANGFWRVTKTGATTFTLYDIYTGAASSGSGAYTSGGYAGTGILVVQRGVGPIDGDGITFLPWGNEAPCAPGKNYCNDPGFTWAGGITTKGSLFGNVSYQRTMRAAQDKGFLINNDNLGLNDAGTLTFQRGSMDRTRLSSDYFNGLRIGQPNTTLPDLTITGATNATPIEITTSTAHGMADGDMVEIWGVTGNTAANGYWKIDSTAADKFTLYRAFEIGDLPSSGNGTYAVGGTARNITLVDRWQFSPGGNTTGQATTTSTSGTVDTLTIQSISTGGNGGNDFGSRLVLSAEDQGGIIRQRAAIVGRNNSASSAYSQLELQTGTAYDTLTTKMTIYPDGGFGLSALTATALGAWAASNGTFAYCSDCTITNPCAGSGTGALAKRLNGAWVCN